ncbi:uncharacterized protein K452DRAFT_212880, partial [Aplosporella prunicola CBS 121167]
EKRKLLEWLSPVDYASKQSEIFKRNQAGTGKWFLESPQFQDFLNGSTSTLFCPGIPGAGKTIMSSLVINELWKRFPAGDRGIAAIYFDYKKPGEQTLESVFAGILKQLVQAQPVIHGSVDKLYEAHHRSGSKPTVEELTSCLSSMSRNYQRVYLVLDALDESDTVTRRKLLAEIVKLQAQGFIQLMATSRPLQDIVEMFKGANILEVRASKDDVRLYVEKNLDFLADWEDAELEKRVVEGIVEAADGIFLLTRLHLDSLEDKVTLRDLEEALTRLPKGSEAVSKAYDSAIERIEFQKPRIRGLARQLISWVTLAKEPLSSRALEHALAIEPGVFSLDQKRTPKMKLVISACAGLVTVESERNIVRLIHYTAQEYFEAKILQWMPKALEDITNRCLTYLMLPEFSRPAPASLYNVAFKLESELISPLAHYAAQYWGKHAQGIQSQVRDLALKFLTSKYIENLSRFFPVFGIGNKTLTGLHLATFFGLSELAVILLQNGHAPNPKTDDGITPLTIAVKTRQERMIELLLTWPTVDVNIRSGLQQTPLQWALTHRDSEKIVKLLLERADIDPNARYINKNTPL